MALKKIYDLTAVFTLAENFIDIERRLFISTVEVCAKLLNFLFKLLAFF